MDTLSSMTLLLAIFTCLLAIAAFCAIWQNHRFRKEEKELNRKVQALDEIIEWARKARDAIWDFVKEYEIYLQQLSITASAQITNLEAQNRNWLAQYNTKSKEEFVPIEPGKVAMCVCGMTVYSEAHIGHARTYLVFDLIRRYFELKKYEVTYVQNITDVDDKIIAAANREGVDALEYAQRYAKRCFRDLELLGIRPADIYPKASETIGNMLDMILFRDLKLYSLAS